MKFSFRKQGRKLRRMMTFAWPCLLPNKQCVVSLAVLLDFASVNMIKLFSCRLHVACFVGKVFHMLGESVFLVIAVVLYHAVLCLFYYMYFVIMRCVMQKYCILCTNNYYVFFLLFYRIQRQSIMVTCCLHISSLNLQFTKRLSYRYLTQ